MRTLSLRDDGTYVEELNIHERLRDADAEGIGGQDALVYGRWSRRGRVVTFHNDDGSSGDAVLTVDGLRLPYASCARVR